MKNLPTIAIRFADNDFQQTIKAWLYSLGERVRYSWDKKYFGVPFEPEQLKQYIVKLFNRSAAGFYWVYQAHELDDIVTIHYSDKDVRKENSIDHIQNYLQIQEKHVFLDNEVAKYIEECKGWDNGETHILEFQTFDGGKIWSPYIYNI